MEMEREKKNELNVTVKNAVGINVKPVMNALSKDWLQSNFVTEKARWSIWTKGEDCRVWTWFRQFYLSLPTLSTLLKNVKKYKVCSPQGAASRLWLRTQPHCRVSSVHTQQIPRFIHAFVVQLLSPVGLFVTSWTAARQASLSFTISPCLPKLMSVESVMPSNHLILCRPLLLPPSIFPSIRVFSSESVPRIRWLKYWSFSFNISPSSEYSGLISFRMDWLDLLAVQGILKRLLQHHSSKASILRRSAFFIVQLSYAYTITGKTIALTRQSNVFVGKVMSLLFDLLCRS